MKIAFLVDQFPALSETFILNQITGILDRGHVVDIYSNNMRTESKIHQDVEKYNLLSRTYYRKPPNKFSFLIKCFFLFVINFHKNPINILKSLNIFRFGKGVFSLDLFYTYICFLNHGPYDIVHCHFGYVGEFGIILTKLGLNKSKIITSFYGNDLGKYINEKGKDAYKRLFNRGDLFLVLSDEMRRRLIEYGCPKKRILVHHLGIKPNLFEFKYNGHNFSAPLRLLTVARLVEKKGLEYSIKAFKQVYKKGKDITYIIVGDGPLRKQLEMLVEKLGISQKVIFVGPLAQGEIINAFKSAHIFILASITANDGDLEGTPTVLLEAMCSGLPVISTLHAGIPEQVINGKSGFLVPERDISALAERLEYLITHPENWPKMGRAGRQHVEEYFDIDKLNDNIVMIYHNLIHND